MDDPSAHLIDECRRQEESCLYTSTALFEWVKVLRRWKIFFVVTPIVLAGVATGLPTDLRPGLGWLIGTCTLLAGIATAVYKAKAQAKVKSGDYDFSADISNDKAC